MTLTRTPLPRVRAETVQTWVVHPPALPSESDEEEPLPEKTYLQTTMYRLRTERAKNWKPATPHPLAWQNWSRRFWVHTLGLAVAATLEADLGLNLLHTLSAPMLRCLQVCFFNAGEVEMYKGSWCRWARSPTNFAELLVQGFAPLDDNLRELCERQQGYVMHKKLQLVCRASSEILGSHGILSDRPHLDPRSRIEPQSRSYTTEDNKHVIRCSIKSVSRKRVAEECLVTARQFAAVDPDPTDPPESGEAYTAASLANIMAQLVQRPELTGQQQKGILFGFEGLRRRAPLFTCIGTKLLQA